MSTELSQKLFDIAPHVSDEDFAKNAKSSTFLPRVQLFGSSSKLVKLGKFPQGHWGLVRNKDQVDDLGTSFDCVVIQYRYKALDVSGDKPVQYFDADSDDFADVVARSKEKDSGCMWGEEFLLWIASAQVFATLFCASPTMRNSVNDIKQLHLRGCTLGCRLIENKQFAWHGPTVSMCSTPMNLPSSEMAQIQNELFTKVEAKEEVAEDDVDDDRDR